MTRIIAGVARGRRLSVPAGAGTRPTSDRAREGLFATVTALRGTLAGARVLDLYAGSGAIGLEALSRGAARAVFVESDPRAAQVIRANMRALGFMVGSFRTNNCPEPSNHERGRARPAEHPEGQVITGQVARVLARGPGAGPPFDVVVADPPYASDDEEIAAMLVALTGGWLAPGAIVAVERASRSARLAWPAGYRADRSRRYGEATFWYGLAAGT
jgi:16S rRNA (guanine966-N2)-methyltransferase